MRPFISILLSLIISSSVLATEKNKAYFAGGCFWCMEESFEKLSGVEEVISGYSGGKTENPTYKEVTYGNTGHFEVIEVIYDKNLISFEKLLENFWKNIDPFDSFGQFCDKGYSYRSVAFFTNKKEKDFIKFFTKFRNVSYKWGGKTYKGIDCSALLQIFFYYNNLFYPRDTKDQIKYSIKKKSKSFKKGDIIFWEGHVAICINSKQLIHAYGPEKRVIVMPINKTIKRILNTANLKVRKISKINF